LAVFPASLIGKNDFISSDDTGRRRFYSAAQRKECPVFSTAIVLRCRLKLGLAMLESQHCLEYLEESSEMGEVNTSYVSDHQTWMNEQLAKNPEWVEDQKAGRALWWDKKQDVDTTARNADSKVPQKSYPYDVNFFGE